MTTSDRAAFVELMVGLGEAYGEAVSAARMEIYFRALEDLPLDVVRAAASIHVRQVKYFPRVAELRDATTGAVEERADLAWVQLLQLVRHVGYWGDPAWPDPILERAARELYGGWRALCERLPSEGPELLGAAKQFKATYIAYARSASRIAAGPCFSREDAKARLFNLRDELVKRGLPAPGLPEAQR